MRWRIGAGCRNLGNIYEFGDGVAKDVAQAAVFFRKSCDASSGGMYGCNNLGTLMYERGQGVTGPAGGGAALPQSVRRRPDDRVQQRGQHVPEWDAAW